MAYLNPEQGREYQRRWQMRRREKTSAERWSAREERLARRATPSPADCNWAAGHFEGEGTVTLTRAGRIMHVRPLVSLSSTDAEAVHFFHQHWPGTEEMKMTRRKKPPARSETTEILDAIVSLLKARGWNPAVIGRCRVEQRDPSRQFHFEFVVGFTGTPPADLKKPDVWA